MFNNILLSSLDGLGIATFAFIIVSAITGIVAVICVFVQIYLYFQYHSSNRKHPASGATGEQAARCMLDNLGLNDVQVKKSGFFWAFIWGNSYSARRKTVYLRRGIFNKSTVTAVAVAGQKVGLALLHANGDKQFKSRYYLAPLALLGPTFVPLIIGFGIIIDIIAFGFSGTLTIVVAALALVVLIASCAFTYVQIPIEKKGVDFARKNLESSGILTSDELAIADKYFKAYIIDFIFAFILKILEIIRAALRLVITVLANKK